ncbi:hypothetical protein [Legionella bononiensis]|uniref:Uncharacterized protein n=1 Tax=Legionella bononiensis TaxID=2793102 RepID=A0ABS1W9Z5_9GAMM|nr:hypothetical protein [Legionella bononiensis]MBL7480632.1 hypothetical protein [Legionella bononiensis]MBL7526169.1 hypothetical protein [Legionella bononiensis]MBL7563336.1 hypothetical protein [Legionella bononiensis]
MMMRIFGSLAKPAKEVLVSTTTTVGAGILGTAFFSAAQSVMGEPKKPGASSQPSGAAEFQETPCAGPESERKYQLSPGM